MSGRSFLAIELHNNLIRHFSGTYVAALQVSESMQSWSVSAFSADHLQWLIYYTTNELISPRSTAAQKNIIIISSCASLDPRRHDPPEGVERRSRSSGLG